MEFTGGSCTEADAQRLRRASHFPTPDWRPGDTEPWVIEAVAALLIASGHQQVVELGGYSGACSVALAETLDRMGGGRLIVMERYAHHVAEIQARLASVPASVAWEVWETDVLDGIDRLADRSVGVAWVDDSHDAPHVIAEVERLLPKIGNNGLILFHDVWGAYGLHYLVEWYGGIALNLPRVSIGGGLGILQVTEQTRTLRPFPRFTRIGNDEWERLTLGPDYEAPC